ncbi:DgyrCDS6549 [Dimorphilus gyrociliatus]|uniref:DgyrCDS6549 n=1 Tax=Dimorphilus gyrociliatus TaxID=2664684 RepID=A0A7I8VP05_9ANNE|nr:DgyrCDS6549 [Dimorphilus gyrociliatus]
MISLYRTAKGSSMERQTHLKAPIPELGSMPDGSTFINLISSDEDNDSVIVISSEDENEEALTMKSNFSYKIFTGSPNFHINQKIIHIYPDINGRHDPALFSRLCQNQSINLVNTDESEPDEKDKIPKNVPLTTNIIDIEEYSLEDDSQESPLIEKKQKRVKGKKSIVKKARKSTKGRKSETVKRQPTKEKRAKTTLVTDNYSTSTLFPSPANCIVEEPEIDRVDNVTFYWNSSLSAASYWSNYNLTKRPPKSLKDLLSPGDAKVLLESYPKLIPTRRRKLENLVAKELPNLEFYKNHVNEIANMYTKPKKSRATTVMIKINKNLAACIAKTADPFLPKRNLHKIFNSSEVSETRRMKKSKSAREEFLPYDNEDRNFSIEKVNPVCEKSFCYLGCICKSLKTNKEDIPRLTIHCRKLTCMFHCVCEIEKKKPQLKRHTCAILRRSKAKEDSAKSGNTVVKEKCSRKSPLIPKLSKILEKPKLDQIEDIEGPVDKTEDNSALFKVSELMENEIPDPTVEPNIVAIFRDICMEYRKDFTKFIYQISLNEIDKARVFSTVKCDDNDFQELLKNLNAAKEDSHITKLSTGKYVMITPKSVLNENHYEVFINGVSKDLRLRNFTGKFLKCSKQYQALTKVKLPRELSSKEECTLKPEPKLPDKLPIPSISQAKRSSAVFSPLHTGISSLNNFNVKYNNGFTDKENDKLPINCNVSSNFKLLEQVNIDGRKNAIRAPHFRAQIVTPAGIHLAHSMLKPRIAVLPSTHFAQFIAVPHPPKKEIARISKSEVSWEEAMSYVSSSEEEANSSQ